MQCPNCQAEVPDNHSACSVCHAPLMVLAPDTSPEAPWTGEVVEGSTPGADEVFTSAESVDQLPQPPPAPRGGFAPQGEIKTSLVSADPEVNRATKIMSLPLSPAVKKATRQAGAGKDRGHGLELEESELSRGVDDLIASIRLFFARMHRLDRITFRALLVTFVASFLPWAYIRGVGLIAGIQDFGAGTAAGVALIFLCIYGRTHRRRLTAWMLFFQVLLAAAVVALPVYRFLFFQEMTFVYGLHLTALSGAAVVLLTLLRLTRLTS